LARARLVLPCLVVNISITPSDWDSSGVEATEEQQKHIPPVNGNPSVQGSTVDEYVGRTKAQRRLYAAELRDQGYLMAASNMNRRLMQVNASKIIAGGTYFTNFTNLAKYQSKFESYMNVPETTALAGKRTVGPWDCLGLSGVSCCAMIKHSVRDADVEGNAIQCWIEPVDNNGLINNHTLTRKKCDENMNRICIYEMHDGYVGMTPILAFDEIVDAEIAGGRSIIKSPYPASQYTL